VVGFLLPRVHDPQPIKNGREPFLTSRSDGPQGGRHGWQAIKNARLLAECGHFSKTAKISREQP
jgi:hypothetical protein